MGGFVSGKHIWILLAAAMAGQSQPAGPAFEVVSIKSRPKDRQGYTMKRECTGNRFEASDMPMSFLIEWSYGINDSRIFGLPEWAKGWDVTYDFEAAAAMPINLDQCKSMFRNLLAERFRMASHRETRELRAYALVIGKNGPKLRPEGEGVRINGARFQAFSDAEAPKGLPMRRLASILSDVSQVGLPVVDRTGLDGSYSFALTYSTKEGDDRPSIFTAVQEQLGLKLEPARAPLEVLVIDRIEKASAN